jgi:hypothetical protein
MDEMKVKTNSSIDVMGDARSATQPEIEKDGESHGRSPRPARGAAKGEAARPSDAEVIYPVPLVLAYGTRNLGRVLAGEATWTDVEADGCRYAVLEVERVGQIYCRFRPAKWNMRDIESRNQQMTKSGAEIIEHLGPGALKTMVAVSRLMFEKAVRDEGDEKHEAVLGLREVAVAAGYRANNRTRCIERGTLERVRLDLEALKRIWIDAATEPASRAEKRAPIDREWALPFLSTFDACRWGSGPGGTRVPRAYRTALSYTWEEAPFDRSHIAQIPAGFVDLDPVREGQAIKIAWHYLMRFRERMSRTGNKQETVRIRDLCAQAGIDPGDKKNQGRFLKRLEAWHARLRDLGVIGAYNRVAPEGAGPAVVFARGSYVVERPPGIRRAYDAARDNARQDAAARRGAARAGGRARGEGRREVA